MLEWLKLIDFQKHKKKFIRFDPHVTTIIGDSDRGKSAILRGLGFLCLNYNPRRGKIIRHGRSKTKVVLRLDKHTVVREKGKTNQYKLGKKKFKAVGNSAVPEEIANVLNMGDDNFQWQLDQPYWFTDSPGNVSRKLNQIVNLEVIDQTLKNVATELRQTKAELDVSVKRLKDARKERKKLDWVVQFHKDVQHLTQLKNDLDAVSLKCSQIEGLVSDVQRVKLKCDRASKAIVVMNRAVDAGRRALQCDARAKDLESLIAKIRKTKKRLKRPVPDISDLQILRKEADQFCEWVSEFEEFVEKVKTQKEKVCQSNRILLQSKSRLEKKLKGRCPYCKRKMTKRS